MCFFAYLSPKDTERGTRWGHRGHGGWRGASKHRPAVHNAGQPAQTDERMRRNQLNEPLGLFDLIRFDSDLIGQKHHCMVGRLHAANAHHQTKSQGRGSEGGTWRQAGERTTLDKLLTCVGSSTDCCCVQVFFCRPGGGAHLQTTRLHGFASFETGHPVHGHLGSPLVPARKLLPAGHSRLGRAGAGAGAGAG